MRNMFQLGVFRERFACQMNDEFLALFVGVTPLKLSREMHKNICNTFAIFAVCDSTFLCKKFNDIARYNMISLKDHCDEVVFKVKEITIKS